MANRAPPTSSGQKQKRASQRTTQVPAKVRVGQNVHRLRNKRGLTLQQFSERLKKQNQPIGVTTLSKIELGQREISVANLEALAGALGVTADTLLAHADMDALVRMQRLITQIGAADYALFEADQNMFTLQAQIEDRRQQLAGLIQRLAEELTDNREIIGQLSGEGADRAVSVALAIVEKKVSPMEAARYLR